MNGGPTMPKSSFGRPWEASSDLEWIWNRRDR